MSSGVEQTEEGMDEGRGRRDRVMVEQQHIV